MSNLVKNLRNPDWVKEWFDQAGFQAADRIEELEAQLEAAFYEGFCEGRDGTWVEGDPTPAWKKSDTLAELKGQDHGN